MEWNNLRTQLQLTRVTAAALGLLSISLQKLYEQGWTQGNIYVLLNIQILLH